jgi:glycogen debranching enzyme
MEPHDQTPSPELKPPDYFKLYEGEELIRSDRIITRRSATRLSSLRELTRLTNAPTSNDIGNHGPSIASLALAEADSPTPEYQELYSVVFGRDSLRVANDLIEYYPKLAITTIIKLTETQGTTFNAAREEEPGRIAHEIRSYDDPLAQKISAEDGWDWPYYGSVDATPEFIRLIASYCSHHDPKGEMLTTEYVDRDGNTKTIAESFSLAVDWLKTRLDDSSLGLLEFKSSIPGGLVNQAWKDSWDSYHHEDGELANHSQGIASVEVQSLTYDALYDAAEIYEKLLGKVNEAQDMRDTADNIKHVVKEKFWTNDKGGYFVLGLDQDDDGNYRQLKIRTSNMGHLLNSRLLDGTDETTVHMRSSLLRQLRSPELLSVSGIRTLASDEIRYREGAYHNGSSWIWDTHYIAKGARRHTEEPAFVEFADHLDLKILNAVETLGSFPEYVRGGDEIAVNTYIIDVLDTHNNNRLNHVEQPPQEIQAWTVAAILATRRRISERAALNAILSPPQA